MAGEIIYQGTIRIRDPEVLFRRYRIKPRDLARYTQLINSGKEEKAIDEFVEEYMNGISELYTATIQDYLRVAESGQLERKDQRSLTSSVVLLSVGLLGIYKDNFKQFVKEAYSPVIFEKLKITSPDVKRAILDATLEQFNTLTNGAMAQTEANVLNHIRTLQREMIVFNQQIKKRVFAQSAIRRETIAFKNKLRTAFPDIYKAMEEGYILKDRRGRNLRLDKYADMSSSTTLLNVDRTSVEVSEKILKSRVVEYYQRDFRRLKTGIEREICKEVLRTSVLGKSVLALDGETADTLGIDTIESARMQGAMAPYCRHSIRPVSKTYARKLEKAFFRKEI